MLSGLHRNRAHDSNRNDSGTLPVREIVSSKDIDVREIIQMFRLRKDGYDSQSQSTKRRRFRSVRLESPIEQSRSLFDQNFPELGIPTATHVPYQAPVKATAAKKESAEKRSGITLQLNQDTLVLITAVLCILFGLSRLVFLNPIAIFLAPKAMLSVGGMLFIANSLVCIGILVAGIGLLLDQEWSIGVGQIAASMYFVLLLINFGISFGYMGSVMDGKTSLTSLARGLSSLLGTLTGTSIVPGLLLYVTLRND